MIYNICKGINEETGKECLGREYHRQRLDGFYEFTHFVPYFDFDAPLFCRVKKYRKIKSDNNKYPMYEMVCDKDGNPATTFSFSWGKMLVAGLKFIWKDKYRIITGKLESDGSDYEYDVYFDNISTELYRTIHQKKV